MDLLVAFGVYWFFKRRKEIKQRDKIFKRNGGLLLEQQLTSENGVVEKTKVFTLSELKKATDHFHEDRIIGQGGQGTVYKGVLADGIVVAVKKAKKVDDSQLVQFINELVILSQINHRNVVKLLGCCLETEVPLLVYEFIPNGTLAQNIHRDGEEVYISWKLRLQIASESAGAIAYLHSLSSTPMYHRDIKSSNILLNEKYMAKVSDFGTSRTISIEQTHLTTQVLGTFGYLDPEYYYSSQFTDKSDVYSFGVVLVELLTSKKPLFVGKSNGRESLATTFLSAMENCCLLDIVDPRVLQEAEKEEVMTVAELSRECLNQKGKYRPSMKKVVLVLEGIRACHESSSKHEPPLEEDHVYASESEGGTCSSDLTTFSS